MLVLNFRFNGDRPPLPDYLPKPSADFLSHITTVNLLFRVVEKSLRLKGPSGETYVFGYRVSGNAPSYTVDWQILRSLYQSIRSTTERLTITQSEPTTPIRADRSQVFQTLDSMKNIRTLTLTKCHNLPFFLALNPSKTPSALVMSQIGRTGALHRGTD